MTDAGNQIAWIAHSRNFISEDREQRSDDRRSKSEVEIRPPGHRAYASAGSRKVWKTDVRLYFYPINLFNPVN